MHTHTYVYKLGNERQTLAYSYIMFLRSQVILMYTDVSLPLYLTGEYCKFCCYS